MPPEGPIEARDSIGNVHACINCTHTRRCCNAGLGAAENAKLTTLVTVLSLFLHVAKEPFLMPYESARNDTHKHSQD